jgi:phage gpG-like protein
MPRPQRIDFPDFTRMQGDFQKIVGSLPGIVGNAAVNFYKDSWNRSGYIDQGIKKWPPRKRSASRARILVRTGRLRRSIRYRTTGSRIHLFTDVPYAQIHNEGGAVNTSANVRAHTRRMKNGYANVRAHSRRVNFTMPQRQFMDIPGRPISRLLDKRIRLILQKAFEAALQRNIKK